ncbi:uncharacterized protein LOC120416426 [Culex pipiens pallens]|uniref:uncharacterized protein LOC120416426 n=1 Tax=Culex pipiens pallens TaxID=42434 RepID=UPI001952A133|nr:uncharacterized protein LOC120416426 [Culex pipiens pallens]XP_052562201.1 uncharacterized protein LOC120416426 [Culex pipiens pallens]
MFRNVAQKLDVKLKHNMEFNLKLVELVQQNSSLYVHEPMRTNQLQTWEEIAETLGVSCRYTRAHWRWLRVKYAQFVKLRKPDHPAQIESHMHFLRPHLRIQSRTLAPPPPPVAEWNRKPSTPLVPRNTRVESCAHLGYDPGDQDAAFLLSILPHLKVMTGQQRRQFKMGAVKLSAEMLAS